MQGIRPGPARVALSAMRIQCAECGCWVERGVRVELCAVRDCCCVQLPVREQGRAPEPNPRQQRSAGADASPLRERGPGGSVGQ